MTVRVRAPRGPWTPSVLPHHPCVPRARQGRPVSTVSVMIELHLTLTRGPEDLSSRQRPRPSALPHTSRQVASTFKTEARPTSRRQWLGPLTTDGLPYGEHLKHQLLLETLRRPMTRPIMHSHLTEHAAVARATAGKVLASRCAR